MKIATQAIPKKIEPLKRKKRPPFFSVQSKAKKAQEIHPSPMHLIEKEEKKEPSSFSAHIDLPREIEQGEVSQVQSSERIATKPLFQIIKTEILHLSKQQEESITQVQLFRHDPSSPFHGAEITFHHYQTAPHSFNIQFCGKWEGLMQFNQHLPYLTEQLQEHFPHFQINFLPSEPKESNEFSKRNDKRSIKKWKKTPNLIV